MVPNTLLSHNLSIYYYNKDVYKDQSDYRSIRPDLLEILQHSQENTSARVSFLIKLQAWGLQLY